MTVINLLINTVFTLTGKLAVINSLSNSFSSRYYNYFLGYLQASIPSMVLCIFFDVKIAAIQFGQRTFVEDISEHRSPWNKLIIIAAIFLQRYRLWLNESSRLKQLLFLQRNVFKNIPSCLEQLLPSYNYFLVAIYFS